MVKIETLMKKGRISRINELELQRYINFFKQSYKENLEHCKFVKEEFPRWSIIAGYYAMHDITKLFLAKEFRLKIDFKVHSTTINVVRELIKNKPVINLIENGYQTFISLANDLVEAKKQRVKVQYYTGTEYMKKQYKENASVFLKEIVEPYLEKIKEIMKKE